LYPANDPNDPNNKAICQQFFSFQFKLLIISNLIVVFISVVNMILSTLTIKMITWIGYDT